MLNNLRNRLPDIEETGGAVVNRVVSAASSAAQTARGASGQLEGWAKDGLDTMKTRPLMWGTVSLGLGALMGGLFALWRKPKRIAAKTMPARAHAKRTLRAAARPTIAEAAKAKAPKKRALKATRAHSAEIT